MLPCDLPSAKIVVLPSPTAIVSTLSAPVPLSLMKLFTRKYAYLFVFVFVDGRMQEGGNDHMQTMEHCSLLPTIRTPRRRGLCRHNFFSPNYRDGEKVGVM